jgi:hypothetical protein
MPGRPKMMAKRVTELEEVGLGLALDMFSLVPRQYLDQPNRDDPLNRSWNLVVNVLIQATVVLEQLGDLVRAKAGITEAGPCAKLLRVDEEAAATNPKPEPDAGPPTDT